VRKDLAPYHGLMNTLTYMRNIRKVEAMVVYILTAEEQNTFALVDRRSATRSNTTADMNGEVVYRLHGV
jgi:hypothetical protein